MINTFTSTALSISTTSFDVHPSVNQILKTATTIAKDLGIYESTLYEGHHTMSPYLFITAAPARVVDATIWFGSLYYLDDFFGEDIQVDIEPNLDILFNCWMTGIYKGDEKHQGLNNLYRSIAYASHQIQSNSPNAFFETYTKGLLAHLKHSIHPTNYQSIKEYIDSRIHFGGMHPTMGMIEYTENLYLTDQIIKEIPLLKEAQRDCALIGVLSNDLISYHKEKHSKFNLLNAYMELGVAYDLEEAIELSIAVVNDAHTSFEQNTKAILAQLTNLNPLEKETVITYIKGLSNIVAASYHWQISTNRYRSEENIFTDLKHPVNENSNVLA